MNKYTVHVIKNPYEVNDEVVLVQLLSPDESFCLSFNENGEIKEAEHTVEDGVKKYYGRLFKAEPHKVKAIIEAFAEQAENNGFKSVRTQLLESKIESLNEKIHKMQAETIDLLKSILLK